MRYFDKHHNRLIYVQQNATPEFWDNHWEIDSSIRTTLSTITKTWVTEITQKYLKPEDGTILEGGCGTAIHVAALKNNGYCCVGVDYAPETVSIINNAVPDLPVQQDDVRNLQFEDEFFIGYWSIGVIEHFWDGYRPIATEMARVIKPGGYLFLTFPYMSFLRKVKSRLNLYPIWQKVQEPPSFYQFALDHRNVLQTFSELGFELVQCKPMLGLRATQEELGTFNPLLQKLYDYKGTSLWLRSLKLILSKILTPFAGHMVLLVLKRR